MECLRIEEPARKFLDTWPWEFLFACMCCRYWSNRAIIALKYWCSIEILLIPTKLGYAKFVRVECVLISQSVELCRRAMERDKNPTHNQQDLLIRDRRTFSLPIRHQSTYFSFNNSIIYVASLLFTFLTTCTPSGVVKRKLKKMKNNLFSWFLTI